MIAETQAVLEQVISKAAQNIRSAANGEAELDFVGLQALETVLSTQTDELRGTEQLLPELILLQQRQPEVFEHVDKGLLNYLVANKSLATVLNHVELALVLEALDDEEWRAFFLKLAGSPQDLGPTVSQNEQIVYQKAMRLALDENLGFIGLLHCLLEKLCHLGLGPQMVPFAELYNSDKEVLNCRLLDFVVQLLENGAQVPLEFCFFGTNKLEPSYLFLAAYTSYLSTLWKFAVDSCTQLRPQLELSTKEVVEISLKQGVAGNFLLSLLTNLSKLCPDFLVTIAVETNVLAAKDQLELLAALDPKFVAQYGKFPLEDLSVRAAAAPALANLARIPELYDQLPLTSSAMLKLQVEDRLGVCLGISQSETNAKQFVTQHPQVLASLLEHFQDPAICELQNALIRKLNSYGLAVRKAPVHMVASQNAQ